MYLFCVNCNEFAGTPVEEPLDGWAVTAGTDVANISPGSNLPLSSYLNIGLPLSVFLQNYEKSKFFLCTTCATRM
jgi:hypothetical protein